MILKQLKQLTLSTTRRNADVLWLARLYSSPAVCQSLKPTKAYKRLSREDRRAVVESFVIKYRAANSGKFPSLNATVKEVGGGYYVVRDIFQELKLKPNAPLPIVAKALSEVPASDASSHALNDTDSDPQSHCSASNVEHVSPVVSDPVSLSEVPASDASSHALDDTDSDPQSHCSASNVEHISPVVSDPVSLSEFPASDASSHALSDTDSDPQSHCSASNVEHVSPVVSDPVSLSEVTASDASSHALNDTDSDPQSHCSAYNVELLSPVVSDPVSPSEVPASDASSHALNDTDSDPQSHCFASNVEHVSPVVSDPVSLAEVPASDASSQTLNDTDSDPQSHCSASNLEHVSPVVSDPVLQDGSPDTVDTQSDQKQATIDSPHPDSDEINLQGNNNLVVTATHDKRETETATPSNNDVDSKCDSNTHLSESQTSKVAEECLKNSETEGEEKLAHLDSQEPKADHLEGTAVSANVLPTETSHVSGKEDGEVKTGENSSAWSSIISFAKDFANFWRKG